MKNSELNKMRNELEAVMKKYGVVTKNSARYNDKECRISMWIALDTKKSTKKKAVIKGGTPETHILRNGFASVGDKAMLQGRPVQILKTMRVNYTFEFLDEKSGRYKGRFSMFSEYDKVPA